ncbi:hypothetical protein BX666DRAFT_1914535 [Dichotomocladium elegans]|nr:hypothetical protein BX666DRAFT_1914535 [Dichotomocladium elegans]
METRRLERKDGVCRPTHIPKLRPNARKDQIRAACVVKHNGNPAVKRQVCTVQLPAPTTKTPLQNFSAVRIPR